MNHEIVNLPSISSIATHRKKLKKRDVAPKTLAVLANPVFTVDDPRVKNDRPLDNPSSSGEIYTKQQSQLKSQLSNSPSSTETNASYLLVQLL